MSYIKPKPFENPENHLCDYGCGHVAKFICVSGKKMCSSAHTSCPSVSKKFSGPKKRKSVYFENINGKLCEYGCNQLAHYQYQSSKK